MHTPHFKMKLKISIFEALFMHYSYEFKCHIHHMCPFELSSVDSSSVGQSHLVSQIHLIGI